MKCRACGGSHRLRELAAYIAMAVGTLAVLIGITVHWRMSIMFGDGSVPLIALLIWYAVLKLVPRTSAGHPTPAPRG